MSALARHSGATSPDLALDLVLHQLVEQARMATNASGAAIALYRDHEIVCRATSGWNAPDLGVRLNAHSGISGTCIQSRVVQLCNDTEKDTRVDPESSRRLNVRSILAGPLLHGERLLGVLEVFSSRPNAFSERDVQTLQVLSERIADVTRRAEQAAIPPPEPAQVSATPSEPRPAIEPPSPAGPAIPHPPNDRWTGVLSGLIVTLSIFLVGLLLAGPFQTRRGRSNLGSGTVAGLSTAHPAPSIRPDRTAPDVPLRGPAEAPAKVLQPAASRGSISETPAPGSLVVYEGDRLIYRSPAGKGVAGTSAAAQDSSAPHAVTAEVVDRYLIRRVEPQYPEPARAQHIQGAVRLKALIGKDGHVEKLELVSGDPELARAAMDAVRQWRFRPYQDQGKRVEVETTIVVNFTLS
jgi:TonB family protein